MVSRRAKINVIIASAIACLLATPLVLAQAPGPSAPPSATVPTHKVIAAPGQSTSDPSGHASPTSTEGRLGRRGALTPREMDMAKAAWQYFVVATQDATGLANSVKVYPSTTLWDTASYISALVAAYELKIIDKREFDLRTFKVLGTVRNLDLFRGELPNKVYQTQTGQKVDYANKPGEVGYSALDVGRMLIWLRILKQRYPYLANSVDGIVLRWNFCHVLGKDGSLYGAGIGPDGHTDYFQEGRLGYEEYAAKGFALWGFDTRRASQAGPFSYIDIYGVQVPYDTRDPRVFKTQNYVLAEAYLLEGIELNWDLPDDDYSGPNFYSDGWRAEFATRIYMVQQRRFEETGMLTARTEHQVNGPPYFVYDTIFADRYPWNTLSPTDEYVPDRAAVAVKGALGMWVLWDTPYTDKLFESVAELYAPDSGFYEGLYENGSGYIPLQTANNNGIILAALLYKVEGPILKIEDRSDPEAWYTNNADNGLREQRCLPSRPAKFDCPRELNCGAQPYNAGVKMEEFHYCEPVAAAEWFPGCAFSHPEPGARNCRLGAPLATPVPPAPPAPGSLCRAVPQAAPQ